MSEGFPLRDRGQAAKPGTAEFGIQDPGGALRIHANLSRDRLPGGVKIYAEERVMNDRIFTADRAVSHYRSIPIPAVQLSPSSP